MGDFAGFGVLVGYGFLVSWAITSSVFFFFFWLMVIQFFFLFSRTEASWTDEGSMKTNGFVRIAWILRILYTLALFFLFVCILCFCPQVLDVLVLMFFSTAGGVP